MTIVSDSLLVVALLPLSLVAQQSSVDIEAHWRDIRQTACVGVADLHLGKMVVQGTIVFSNIGKSELLLWRGPHSRGSIKLKPVATQRGRGDREVIFHPLLVVPSSESPALKAAPDHDFILLAPGQSFKETFQFGFPFPTVGNEDRSVQPQGGAYDAFVEILLSDGGSNPPRRAFGGREAASGSVWTDEIPIIIDGAARLEDCVRTPAAKGDK